MCFLSKISQLGRSFVPKRGHPAGWAPENSGFRTRDVTSTKCTIFLIFTETQQSFKFQVLSKEREKKRTKKPLPKQDEKETPTQTDKLKRQQRSYRDGKKTINEKKGKKGGKKRKLRHSCIAPKTTGNSPQVGQVWQVGYVHVQGWERLRCCHQSASSSM